jgi:hypothetical protein
MLTSSLALCACGVLDQETSQGVKEDTGMDPGSDTSVVQTAMGGNVVGNQDEAGPLAVSPRDTKRALEEDKGDAIFTGGAGSNVSKDQLARMQFIDTPFSTPSQLAAARERYRAALQSTDPNSPEYARLKRKIGDTYAGEAVSLRSTDPNDNRVSQRWHLAADEYGNAASNEPNATTKAALLARQAHALYAGGYGQQACGPVREALQQDPGNGVAAYIRNAAKCS